MGPLSRCMVVQRHLPLLLSRSNHEPLPAYILPRCYTTIAAKRYSAPPTGELANWIVDRAKYRFFVRRQIASIIQTAPSSDGNSKKTKDKRKDLKVSLQQFNNENQYIHSYVTNKLADLSNLRHQSNSSHIMPFFDEFKLFTEERHTDELAYKAERSDYFKLFKSSIRKLNTKNLAILLSKMKDNEKSEFRVIKNMVDVELYRRLNTMKRVLSEEEVDQYLYMADVFFQCSTITTFIPELVRLFAERDDLSLNDEQLMFMLFLVILVRDHKGLLTRYHERILEILENKPTLKDLSIICLSYFKTKSPMTDSVMKNRILNRTIEVLPSVDFSEPGFAAIIKCIRYSRMRSDTKDNVTKLITKVTRDPSLTKALDNLFNLTQIAKLMETYRIYDPSLLDRIRDSIFLRINDLRIKDIQYLLTTLSNSRWRDSRLDDSLKGDFDTLCESLVKESRPDAMHQLSHLLPITRSFMTFGYYNDQFINYLSGILENDSIVGEMREKTLEFEKTSLLAYAATHLESKGAKLNINKALLSELSGSIKRIGSAGSLRKDSSIEHLNFILAPNIPEKFFAFSVQMRSIARSLASAEGLNCPQINFSFQFTMAHQNYADLVISLNGSAPGSFDPNTALPRTIEPNQRHCLVYAVRDFDFMDGRDRLSGFKKLIMRLLTRLGYDVIVVNLDKLDIAQLSGQIRSLLRDQVMKSPAHCKA